MRPAKMITDKDLLKILTEACKKSGSQRQWALDNEISPQHVNDVLKGKRDPAEKIGKALGYKKTKGWIKKSDKKPPKFGMKYEDK
jgi:hypothetical protein